MPRVLKKAELSVSQDTQPAKKKEPSVHLSLQLARSLVVRVEAVGRHEGMPRYAFIAKLLDQGLRKYAFDAAVRAGLGETQVPDGEAA
jgi:hypothetical protein